MFLRFFVVDFPAQELKEARKSGAAVALWGNAYFSVQWSTVFLRPNTPHGFTVMSTDSIAEWPDFWNGRGIG